MRGKRQVVVRAGIDAKREPAEIFRASQVDPDALTRIQELVIRAMEHARAGTFQTAEEHFLQARLTSKPASLGLEHPLLREVPASRPRGRLGDRAAGFIDLAGLDGHGDVVIVETKLGGDKMLILQGLDYWIWASANLSWLRGRLHANPQSGLRLLYAVAGKRASTPRIDRYASKQFDLLDPAIDASLLYVSDWQDPTRPARVVPGPSR
jgi:hypothetical protein